MPGCILRVSGLEFDVDRYLNASSFRPCAVFRRGYPRTPGSDRLSETSGFNLEISAESGDRVPAQIRDAVAFLASHQIELARITSRPSIESVTLDFGWGFPIERASGQFNYFPPSFLAACGALRIGIEISVYAISNRDEGEDV